ncbi:Suppressor of Sensor Kinase (SLN1), partial [Ascosphaera pollenicola]
ERGENDAPELKHSRSMRRHQGPPDRSFITNSEGSEEYVAHAPPAVAPNNTNSHAAETTTRIRDDKGGNMILKFEVLIVKVPLFSLHGIQFKKISGGMWQYKEMAKKILDELKL